MNGDTRHENSTTADATAPAELSRRLEALENRIAYQEHWLDTLDEAVVSQEKRLSTLERINNMMQEKLREQHQALLEGGEPRPEDEVPPHY